MGNNKSFHSAKFRFTFTHVYIGVMVFDESLTFRLVVGIVLILSAVLLIVLGKNFHLRTISHTITVIVRKTWRWKS